MSLVPVKEESIKEESNDDGLVINTFIKQEPIDILCSDIAHKKKPNSEGVSAETVYKELKSYQIKEEFVDARQDLESANNIQDTHFKEEPASDSEDVNAAAKAELYANHQVKEELMIGPELLHPLETAQSSPESPNTSATCKKEHLDSKSARSSDESFICTVCSKAFKDKDTCIEHLLKHTGFKFYPCQVCNKEFSTKYFSLKHIKGHKNRQPYEVPYFCNICNEKFLKPIDLVTHKKAHMVEKSFQCDICKKKYLHEISLKRHEKTHDSAFKGRKVKMEKNKQVTCDICNKKLSSKVNLSKHKIIHTGLKPFSCEVCGRCFADYSNMLRHKVLIHT